MTTIFTPLPCEWNLLQTSNGMEVVLYFAPTSLPYCAAAYKMLADLPIRPTVDEWIAIQLAAIANVPIESISLDEIQLRRLIGCSDKTIIDEMANNICQLH